MSQVTSALGFLFPGNAMVNSLLATSYISLIPNLLLYLVPPNIKKSSLNILVSFAVGSLLGDVFLHLLPHAFEGGHHEHGDAKEHDHHHDHSDRRNVLIGCGIFVGVFIFYATDKILRDYLGFTGHDHDHEVKKVDTAVVESSVSKPANNLRQRKGPKDEKPKEEEKEHDHHHHQVRASTYLNLVADFTHNLTDGIALAASFYASPAVGATTAVAVFFHEIPHEISDYAILVQSGFSKKRAMLAQFTTAIGAFIGTFIGIGLEEFAHQHDHHDHHHHGLLGTGVTLSDLIIPVTAGGFLYIATVSVLPELLEGEQKKSRSQPIKELLAMIFGVALMAVIAWNESHHH